MIRPKLSLRRPLAVLGAAFVGLTAAVAVAAPASAHHPIVSGTAVCDTATGNWAVDWTVANSEKDLDGKLTKVELGPEGTEVSNITEGATLPKSGDGNLTGRQLVPGSGAGKVTEASLKVTVRWIRNGNTITNSAESSVHFQGTCQPATSKPTATFASNCDGTVVVTLVNAKDATKDAEFVVKGEDGFTENKTVAAGASATVKVPAENAAKIVVTEKNTKDVIAEGKWTEPKDCTQPGEPSGEITFTCDEMIFTIANPKDGESITMTFTPNRGAAQTVTIAPGETKTVKFEAFEGLTVTPTGGGLEDPEPIAWEQPDGCEEEGPTLPVTGAAAGGIAGGAAVLLAAGVALFLVARRRRIRFTA